MTWVSSTVGVTEVLGVITKTTVPISGLDSKMMEIQTIAAQS